MRHRHRSAARAQRAGAPSAALRDAPRERGAEEANQGHDEHPEVPEQHELVSDGEREDRASERGAERAGEALRAGPACQLLVTERSLGDSQVGLTMANCAMPLVTPSEAALGAASLTRIMLTL